MAWELIEYVFAVMRAFAGFVVQIPPGKPVPKGRAVRAPSGKTPDVMVLMQLFRGQGYGRG